MSIKSVKSKIESLLFLSVRPLSIKNLQDKLQAKKDEIILAIEELIEKYNQEGSGINIQKIDDKVQMVTSKDNGDLVRDFLNDETTGELTPASLETLTVIAYRGPVTKSELELIRGVNCSLILKNLIIRGLIEEKKDKDSLVPTYQVTFDFLKFLGISQTSELPDFEKLNSDENLQKLLNPEAVQEGNKEEVADTSQLKHQQ